MNLPNKITMARVLLIPLMLVIFYLDTAALDPQASDLNPLAVGLGLLFIFASLTDYVDGYLARKHGLVTTFGKFLDPLADKLLVMAALLMLLETGVVPMWVVFIILSREMIVTGLRLIVVGDGAVIAASNLGKYKTASTLIAIILLFFHIVTPGLVILYIATALTLISGVDYLIKNMPSIAHTK